MPHSPVLRHIVTFGRVLREAGLEVGPGRLADALRGLDRAGLARPDDVYWTLCTALVSRREDMGAFDRAFRAWFLAQPSTPRSRRAELGLMLPGAGEGAAGRPEAAPDAESDEHVGGWSAIERLRHLDFAAMTDEDLVRARAAIAELRDVRPSRRSRRLRPSPRGRRLDLRRVVRASLATGGEPIELARRARVLGPRKLVLLCDVSGSMAAYSRMLILFLHAALRSGPRVEAFAFGTRLTRLTPELAARDPERALEAAAGQVVDWSSGTRIGAALKTFNDEWGRRALAHGAVVVIASDGWERESPELVARQMARLARAAYQVVWVNPLKGHPDYQPLAGGMRAALPYVDRFVAGHTLASLEELARLLAGIERRHAA